MCIDRHWQNELQTLTDKMETTRLKASKLTSHDQGFFVAHSIHLRRCEDVVMYVRNTFGTTAFFANFLKQELRDAIPDQRNSESFINRYKWNIPTDLSMIGQARAIGLVFNASFVEAQKQIATAQVYGVTGFARSLAIA